MDAFMAGTVAGSGSFNCEACGFAIAFQEGDEVPVCPECRGTRFSRAPLFGSHRHLDHQLVEGPPAWLDELRGDCAQVAFELDHDVHGVQLSPGWTRIGRSLAADLRLDDPTVSRRHALIYHDDAGARVLDDRSLNGVFVNGERIELGELRDGDEVAIGRFRLYFLVPAGVGERPAAGSFAG